MMIAILRATVCSKHKSLPLYSPFLSLPLSKHNQEQPGADQSARRDIFAFYCDLSPVTSLSLSLCCLVLVFLPLLLLFQTSTILLRLVPFSSSSHIERPLLGLGAEIQHKVRDSSESIDRSVWCSVIAMANVKGTPTLRNSVCTGKQSFLPPKSPFPSVSPAYADYSSNHCIPTKGIQKPRDGHRQHQRTSSESILIEEQPSWLDDLLNEPETPVRRGTHRRSSSDSFAYLDASDVTSNIDNRALTYKSLTSQSSWGSEELVNCKDMPYTSYYRDASNFGRQPNRGREATLNNGIHSSNVSPMGDKLPHHCLGSSGPLSELDAVRPTGTEKPDQEELAHNQAPSLERREGSQIKHSPPEADQKRVKQQFAQRSRVRKLQYIAELERNVEAMQAEGLEVSAELQFLDQQNLILSLENKTLKQRLDSLAQEQLLKHLQQEMLEREIARLRALCQQQQQPTPTHGRSSSRDLDSRFVNLSLKHKEASSGRDMVNGTLRI